MVGEYVPINFFYFIIFHVPFYMYVFLTKQLSMTMDGIAGNFTNRFISPSIPRCPHDDVRCTLFVRCFSMLPESTVNFSAMPFSEEKNKSAIVMAWPHVGCFWVIINEWKIDVWWFGSVIE